MTGDIVLGHLFVVVNEERVCQRPKIRKNERYLRDGTNDRVGSGQSWVVEKDRSSLTIPFTDLIDGLID